MSPSNDAKISLRKAREHERVFQWLNAAECYERLLKGQEEDASFAAKTWERIGFCYSLASRQAGDYDGFVRLRRLAGEAYTNAAVIFAKKKGLANRGKSAECRAIGVYVRSWLASEPSEKRAMLDECLKFGREGIEAYEHVGDQLGCGRLCNDLLLCLLERLYVSSDWKETREAAQEGTRFADKTIGILSKLGNKSELLRSYYAASLHGWYASNVSEQEDERRELAQRSLSYSEEACKLSKEVGDPYGVAMSDWAAALCTLLFTEKAKASLEHAKEMLSKGAVVGDNYLRGVASYVLTFVFDWISKREGDLDQKKEKSKQVITYAEDAIRYLKLVSQDYFIAETSLFYAEGYSSLAQDCETNQEERRRMLEKAIDIGRKGLEHATRSGSPDAMGATLHALSKALHFYSDVETVRSRKIKLLEEALACRQEFGKIVERALPSMDWSRGVSENYEGLIRAEFARLEKDKDRKKALLETAVSNMKDGLARCTRYLLSCSAPTPIASVGSFEDSFGKTLEELYVLTGDRTTLAGAIEAYQHAAELFKKVNLQARVAESYWKMARNQDRLGKHSAAAEDFECAFAEYKLAAQKVPHFANFYLDYGTYMNAWSEIERAKSAHDHERYADAMKHYEKIADFLKRTKLWSYLSTNFSAWSALERAENLSRREQTTRSIETFKKAAGLFEEAKATFEKEIAKIQNCDEREKAIELGSASELRKDYCLARADVEEARIRDRRGECVESAEKYDSAADTFERMLQTILDEDDKREIRSIAHMCRAWQKMEMADAEASPELYHQASELFLKAKEHGTGDRTSLIATGNSALSTAMEHVMKFELTREKEDFSKAKQCFVTAASHYLKAGFDNASVWTNAAEILLDAYNYVLSAETEVDPEKKMKTYLLAEKCFARSAGLYETVGYVGKRDEILKTLEGVKEKEKFVTSLRELLTVPDDASSTSVIRAPGMTVEEPVGVSEFEREFVQGNLTTSPKQVAVGENVDLEIELVNVGKRVAILTRVEEILPEGFNLVKKPVECTVSDNFLRIKGRRLGPVETMELRFTLKPRKKGKFAFTPKVQYMSEAGEFRSCQLKANVTVKELGIRGWLRGQD